MSKKLQKRSAPSAVKSPAAVVRVAVPQYDWWKTVEKIAREYDMRMEAAFRKYHVALVDDATKLADGRWGKEQPYDQEYDRERIKALELFRIACNHADSQL
jgi:hypothetical protein